MSVNGDAGTSDRLIRRLLSKRKPRAQEYVDDPDKLGAFLKRVSKKVDKQADDRGPLEEVWDYLTVVLRLGKAYVQRQYTDMPVRSLVLIVAALIYFVNPFDLVPDLIPLGGFVDDAAVLAFVIRQVKMDLDRFRAWESAR